MMVPCVYCGGATQAEEFVRLGVEPCCTSCSGIPLWSGVVGAFLFFGLMGMMIYGVFN